MGDGDKTPLRLQFNPKVRLEFHGATITSDAGLLPIRELDDALGLTPIASDYLQESRTGRNIRHHLVPLLRQSIYSRLAGYDDTNDVLTYNLGNFMRRLVLPEDMKHWTLSSLQTRLIKTGGRLVRHARRLVFQLAEVLVTREMLTGILERISRLRLAPG